jgi:hypothetical protein
LTPTPRYYACRTSIVQTLKVHKERVGGSRHVTTTCRYQTRFRAHYDKGNIDGGISPLFVCIMGPYMFLHKIIVRPDRKLLTVFDETSSHISRNPVMSPNSIVVLVKFLNTCNTRTEDK